MTIQFQTYSIVAGNAFCNADCYFCVSKMTTTPEKARELSDLTVDWRNFHKATKLAQMGGVTTVLITGKGEPTIYPKEISDYLTALQPYGFPLIELQTNGTLFQNKKLFGEHDYLREWYDLGLSTVILSVVGVDSEQNRRIYLPHAKEYPSLEKTVELLHSKGFTVRLGVVMLNGYVDCPEKIEEVVAYCKKHGIEQLTLRPVTAAENTKDPETNRRIEQSRLTKEQLRNIKDYVESNGKFLLNLIHDGRVYDFRGQNLCLTNCLTSDPDNSEVRSLIFFSTGEIMYDWQYPGAIILGKGPAARQRDKGLESTIEKFKVRR